MVKKKIIRLTESQLNDIIEEGITKTLNEIGYRTASLAGGANYNAQQAKRQLKDKNALNKMNISSNIRLSALRLAIHDTIPNLEFHFIEIDKSHMSYEVRFKYYDVQYLDDDRMVLSGQISLKGGDYQNGYIEYNFNQQSFYRVQFLANGNIRRIYKLENDEDFTESFNTFLSFISNFLYSEEDYRNTINTCGPTFSKEHQPHK